MEFLKRYKKKITRRRDFLKNAVKGIIGGGVLTAASALVPQRAFAAGGISPFVGELMIFAGNFAPSNYSSEEESGYRYEQCNGQLIPIVDNLELFTIIGTTFGGNGTTHFALPNLKGKIAIGAGEGFGLTERVLGEVGGVSEVTLQLYELPAHNHSLAGTGSTGTSHIPSGRLLALNPEGIATYNDTSNGNLHSGALSPSGSSSPHNNMPPYQALNFCIATKGNFPPQSGSPDTERFIGEILLFCGTFAPVGFFPCDGQLLNIAEYEPLFSLVGTAYGGDGETTFRLPDLRGRVPVHSNTYLGDMGGEETHTLTANEIPYHTHALNVNSNPGTSKDPTGKFIASNVETVQQFGVGSSATMASDAISNSGGNIAHENMPPFLVINYYIAYTGAFPPHS